MIPPGRLRCRRGFTLVEVMLASFVLVFAITSSIVVLVRGFRTIESARYTDLAAQLLQSGMEDLRLLNWAQLTALQSSQNGLAGNVALDESFSSYSQFSAGTLSRFTLTRTIRTVPRALRSGVSESEMRELILTASWDPANGPRRSLTTTTYYSKGGLNDYFTTAR
jgi:Tfp pilus assembly protein PilV